MIIRVCAFTPKGWNLINKIEEKMADHVLERMSKEEDIDTFVKESFEYKLPILFVGAVGIAVRKIAHYVDNKLTDSPVVVMDEEGKFVIPLLSNHIGGGNALSKILADITCGQVVITTATDVNKVFSVDIFAKNNGLGIANKDGIKKVSSKILQGLKVSMAIHPEIEVDHEMLPDCIRLVDYTAKNIDILIDMPPAVTRICEPEPVDEAKTAALTLVFKPYVLGLGCKKDTDYSKLEKFISKTLSDNGIDESLIASMASINLKKKEKCLLYYEARHRLSFATYTKDELEAVEGSFSQSDFVKSVTGVSNVCERAAMKLAGDGARLLLPKVAHDGMTLSVSLRKARINTWTI